MNTNHSDFLNELKALLAKYDAEFVMRPNTKCLGAEIPVVEFKWNQHQSPSTLQLPKSIYHA